MTTFWVAGLPQTKGSMRAFMRPGWRVPVVTNDNPRNTRWAATVRAEARRHWRTTPMTGPVTLSLTFALPMPKRRNTQVPHITRPDLDKLVRSVKDALTGILYRDDAQVVRLIASKMYSEAPGVWIAAGEASERLDQHEVLVRFARELLSGWRGDAPIDLGVPDDPGDLDGGWVQEIAVKLGLLVAHHPTAPCGQGCACAGFYPPEDFAEGMVTCYRLAEWLRRDNEDHDRMD
jgi:Holliday junction resolvase RusA-like endonuclease